MFDEEIKSKIETFLQAQIAEIKKNPVRFAAVCTLFIVVVIFCFMDENSAGEEIDLAETEIETPAETVDADQKIITVKTAAISNADKNIIPVLGANSEDLYVRDPFKIPAKPKVQPPPELPAVIIPPPVAQVPPAPTEKFVLRGTAIIGDKKSALIQKSSKNEKDSAEGNLIFEVGDTLNGKIIIDINQNSLTFDDGSKLFIETN